MVQFGEEPPTVILIRQDSNKSILDGILLYLRSMHSSSVMREVSSYSREELAETHNWTVHRECETMGHSKLHGKSSSNPSRHKDQGNRECETMGHSALNRMSLSTPPQYTRIYGKDDTEIQYVKSRKEQATPKEHRLPDTTGQICT